MTSRRSRRFACTPTAPAPDSAQAASATNGSARGKRTCATIAQRPNESVVVDLPVTNSETQHALLVARRSAHAATRSPWPSVLALVTAVALGYLIVVWGHRAPVVYADEAGYLGDARWIVHGQPWPMDSASFYAAGYSALIAVFFLADNPEWIYRAALLLNVVLCAVLAASLYFIARRIGSASHRGALLAALIGCVYPAIVVQTTVAWTELTAMTGVALLLLAAWNAVRRPRPLSLVGLAAMVLFLDAVHGRFALLVPITVLLFGYLLVTRRDLRFASASTGMLLIVGWWFIRTIQRAALHARWDPQAAFQPFGLADARSAFPWDIARCLVGQLWYLLAATGGLIVLGVAALVHAFAMRPQS